MDLLDRRFLQRLPLRLVVERHLDRRLRHVRPQVGGIRHRQVLARILSHRLGIVRGDGLRRDEGLDRHAVLFRRTLAPNLDPHVLSPAGGDDGEVFVAEFGPRGQLVLDCAELVERTQRFHRQQLFEDAVHRFERQAARRQVDLAGRRDHVRLVADMDHARLAVEADDRLKQ